MSNESFDQQQGELQKGIRYPIRITAGLLLFELWVGFEGSIMDVVFQLNFIAHCAIFAAAFLSSRGLSISKRNAWYASAFYFATALSIFYAAVFIAAVFHYALSNSFIVGLLVFCASLGVVVIKAKNEVSDWRLFSILIVIFTAIDKVSTLIDPTSDYPMVGIGIMPMLGIAAALLFSAVLQYSIVMNILRHARFLPEDTPLFQFPSLDKNKAAG